MELGLPEDAQEDVLGEDVLEQHLPDVGLRHAWANALPAQLQEVRRGHLVLRVVNLRLVHGLPQVGNDGGQVGLELLLGLAELLYLGKLVLQEGADEPVKLPGAGHVSPHGLFAVLYQDGDLGVLKDDVVPGIAPVELSLDLGVQVVAAVLGLPVTPAHAE